MSVSSKKSRGFNITSLIVLHILIVLPLAYFLNIWADEASTLYTTQRGFMAAFQNAATDEKQAPLYFWIMSLWRSVNGSIFFARLFSIICSVTAIKLFADLARRFFKPRAALLATAFFAFHPFLIWASVEIRVYSLVILLSVLLATLFYDASFGNGDKKTETRYGTKVLFLPASIFALYTNYYLGFMLIGFFAALLVSRKWRDAGVYLGLMFIAAIAFSPLIIELKSQFAVNTSGFQEQRSLFEGLRYLWHHFLTFILPTEVFPDVQVSPADIARVWIMRVVVITVGIFAVVRRNAISSLTLSIGAVTITISLCLLLAYFLVGSSYIELRHASVIFVPLILFTASLFSDLFGGGGDRKESTVQKVGAVACGLLVLASFSYALVTLYPNMTKRGDWARVASFIEQNETPGQPIIIFTTFDVLALPYHYRGVNKILPDEKFFSFDLEAAFGTENSLKKQTDFVISKIPADADAIWLVVSEKCLVTEACRPLENYVQANYTIEKDQEFYLEKVWLLRKKVK